MRSGSCSNRLALPLYGKNPSAGVCGQCEHRNGLRGAGDALAWVLSWTPLASMQRRKCDGCRRRQETMNSAVSFKRDPCRTCGGPRSPELPK